MKKLNLQLFSEEAAPVEEAAPQQENPLHQQFRAHLQGLENQAENLRQVLPELDLHRELRNPLFSRLTSPGVGLSVEDAYYTVHRREMQSAAMAAAARQVTNSIASGAMRPRENGLNAQAPAVSAFDYRAASREQRNALKKQIRQAAAEGRKIYPR